MVMPTATGLDSVRVTIDGVGGEWWPPSAHGVVTRAGHALDVSSFDNSTLRGMFEESGARVAEQYSYRGGAAHLVDVVHSAGPGETVIRSYLGWTGSQRCVLFSAPTRDHAFLVDTLAALDVFERSDGSIGASTIDDDSAHVSWLSRRLGHVVVEPTPDGRPQRTRGQVVGNGELFRHEVVTGDEVVPFLIFCRPELTMTINPHVGDAADEAEVLADLERMAVQLAAA